MPLLAFTNMLPAESNQVGATLLAIARAAIAEVVGLASSANESAPWLTEHHACFVTLRKNDNLRGCVGSIEAQRSLLEDLKRNAVGAALHDTRFPCLRAHELAETVIEVSLLTPPQALLPTATEAELVVQLVPGFDGVVIELGSRRATFLPQVWESLPEPREFLAELKLKAELLPDYWSRELRVSRYRVQKWSEEDLIGVGAR
jgi:AmmeMemoRadiSam system protein A